MPGLTTAFAQGVAAARPAAATSNAGYVFFATDTGILAQSTGSSWTTIGPAVALDALTAKGDVLTRTSSGYARQAVGSDAQVLTADSTQSTGVKWATPASGFADPMTTRGDLIVRGGSGTTRLALGSSGQYLKSDGTDAQWAAGGGALTQLATAAGTGSSGVITFSSISGSYNALELHWYARTDAALAVAAVTANGDTTSGNYAWQELQANASNGAGLQNTSAANMRLIVPNSSGDTAHYYAGGRLLIPQYANTAHFKIFISQHGRADGPCLEMATGLWKSTSALTSLTLTTGGGNWTTDSKFYLYGVT